METIKVSTVDDLLAELRPNGKRWQKSSFIGDKRPLYIFRGQRDSSWNLTPGIFREVAHLKNPLLETLLEVPKTKYSEEPLKTRYVEFKRIQKFLYLADREGILPPTFELPNAEGERPNWWSYTDMKIPIKALYCYALGQHYGVKTRLLDWSYSSLSALYFAASDCWRNQNINGTDNKMYFAVWALASCGTKNVKILAPNFSSNLNLRSQKGLFTYNPFADKNFNDGAWKSHNALIIEDENEENGTIGGNRKVLYKIEAPASIAKDVLVALRYEGIDGVSLMPSLESIANTVDELSELHNYEIQKRNITGNIVSI